MLVFVFLSISGLLLSLPIVIPAPTMSLLPLGVAAPEVSPWLFVLNTIALIGLSVSQKHPSWLYSLCLVGSLIGLLLSVLPLIQLPATNAQIEAQMQNILGADYQTQIPSSLRVLMRSHPFVLIDAFRGITPGEVRIERNIPFANPDGHQLKLNLYRPLDVGKYPAVVVIYGGAWQRGTPNNDEICHRYLASQGYTVLAIDYRHAPQYPFPAQLEDVQTALAFIENHADQLEVDPERLAIMGRSAGGHLASLAAYQGSVPLKAVINYYGPSNLAEEYDNPPYPDPINTRAVLRTFLGGTPEEVPVLYHNASPVAFVKQNLPPSLLIYAGRDHLVQAKFGRKFYNQLREAGNLAVWLEIPWAEHAFDAVFNGVGNQLTLYYVERFLAWALSHSKDYS